MSNDPNKLMASFARRIAEVRKQKGLTQDALADKANVTGGYIRMLESGKQNVTLSTVSRLAYLLDCNPKTFFDTPKTTKPHPGRPRRLK